MTSPWERFRGFWTVPRFVALLVIVAAFFAFKFIATKPYTGPSNLSEDQAVAISGGDDAIVGNNGHLSMQLTLANMRADFNSQGWNASVVAHGADIKVTFHNQPAVCIFIPVKNGNVQQTVLVSC